MERLLKARSTTRGWLTRASRALDEISQKDGVTEIELVQAMSELNTRIHNLDDIQSQIELETDQSKLDETIDEAFAYRQKHLEVKIKAETVLERLKTNKQNQSLDSQSVYSETNKHFNFMGHARLPKLELPKFGGNYLEFTSFFDKFLAVVDSSNLPAVTKFTYLQSLLTGEALASIKGLTVTDESYPVAKEILTKRYGRKERIIFAHVQKLLTLQVDFRKSNSLWHLYDSLQSHVRCLETLGVAGDTYGVILTPLVLSRMPEDIRLEWARDGEGRESDLAFLLEFLYKEIKRRERSQSFQKTEEQRKVKEQSTASVAAFHASTEGIKKPLCCFCSKLGHKSEECFSLKKLSGEDIKAKVREQNLCFLCFGKHFAKRCTSKRRCKVCNGQHHSFLCRNDVTVRTDQSNATEELSSQPYTGSVNYAHFKSRKKTTLMQVVKTTVQSKTGKVVDVNLLFDGGSDRSFITESLAKRLQLSKSGQETFGFSGFGGSGPGPRTKRNIFYLELGGVGVELAEIPTICADMFRTPVPENIMNKFDVTFTEDLSIDRSIKIDILIGLDYYWKLVTCQIFRVENLVAQKTSCGWMLSGEYTGKTESSGLQLLCVDNVPESLIRSMWELDSVGITDWGQDEGCQKIVEKFHSTVAKENDRYVVGLPWKDHLKGKLIDNKPMAEKRLQSLAKRLAGKPGLKEAYNQNFREMEEAGIIKEVNLEKKPKGPVFYLPHRPVVKKDSKTTKVRPVFDASIKGFNGISLNGCLETGPNLLPNLLEILLRFRRWKIAVTADVAKAFLQIKVQAEDQNVLRFLWDQEGKTKVMVFDRVPFGTKSSPFLLNATIKHHLEKYPGSRAVSELENNLYVDDFLSGADTVDEACRLAADAKEIMSEAGMDLTKWSSNSKLVADSILKELDQRFDVGSITKVLGLKWIPEEDSFSFNGIEVPEDLEVTKRTVLSFIARLFDPLGFFTPFTITAKLLFQELWELGVDWDSKLADSVCHQFGKWLRGIKDLQCWQIPRCLVETSWNDASDLQIHVFCDASEKAYGCCAYLRLNEGKNVKVSLVLSKARVAPLKRITLPRLELLAAVLGARMVRFVQSSLNLPKDVVYKCYTDSMITLQWIQNNANRWKTFVANRVQEIQDLTDPLSWTHCAGSENPADLLTRGASAHQLMTSSVWLQGPAWLLSDNSPPDSETTVSLDEGVSKSEERQCAQCVSLELKSKTDSFISLMSRWSSLSKAIRVMGWILRFVGKCAKWKRETVTQLTNDELLTAHTRLTQITQAETFGEEIGVLKANKSISKSSPLYKLHPFLGEDGLLRAKCRLNYSDLSYDEKFPIILPRCHFSLLMVKDAHLKLQHAGVNQLIATIRNQYWVIGLRPLAKRVKGECLSCKLIDAKACQEPIAPLMEARLKQAPPFNTVGVDYAGPIYCKDFRGQKFYVLLFTCAVIRAVHLELVASMSLSNFLLAFRRFVARRGVPATVFSDNAKTFKSASTELFNLYGSNSPKWRFSVPRAPWWGGWWERMIKSMKTAMKKTVGLKSLEKIELETTLAEVEACLNSRPLTFVGDDIENGQPLTPSHFLLGRGNHMEKVTTEILPPTSVVLLKERDREIEARMSMFWTRWLNEYLKELPLPKRRDRFGRLEVGSVVLVREDNCPRLQWPIGIVEELVEGRDGVMRTVKVKTKTGSFMRPIQRIHDLELHAHPITADSNVETVSKYGRVIKPPDRY